MSGPRTQSIKVLLKPELRNDGVTKKERLMAAEYQRFHDLVAWLRENWDCESMIAPLPMNMPNTGLHYVTKDCLRSQYMTMFHALALLNLFPPPPPQPIQKAIIRATLILRSEMDEGNSIARLKWTEDYLVDFGYIADDSRKHLHWGAMPDQVIDFKSPSRAEITIEAVE